jgi:hypothetical protein
MPRAQVKMNCKVEARDHKNLKLTQVIRPHVGYPQIFFGEICLIHCVASRVQTGCVFTHKVHGGKADAQTISMVTLTSNYYLLFATFLDLSVRLLPTSAALGGKFSDWFVSHPAGLALLSVCREDTRARQSRHATHFHSCYPLEWTSWRPSANNFRIELSGRRNQSPTLNSRRGKFAPISASISRSSARNVWVDQWQTSGNCHVPFIWIFWIKWMKQSFDSFSTWPGQVALKRFVKEQFKGYQLMRNLITLNEDVIQIVSLMNFELKWKSEQLVCKKNEVNRKSIKSSWSLLFA